MKTVPAGVLSILCSVKVSEAPPSQIGARIVPGKDDSSRDHDRRRPAWRRLLADCVADAVPDLILQRDQRRRRQTHRGLSSLGAIDHQGGDVDLAVREIGIALTVSTEQCRARSGNLAPAAPERVTPASASQNGPVPRVRCTKNGAGNSAVSYWDYLPRPPLRAGGSPEAERPSGTVLISPCFARHRVIA
jgi:hypothetical protein